MRATLIKTTNNILEEDGDDAMSVLSTQLEIKIQHREFKQSI